MSIEKIDIQKFLELAKYCPILDVRSPGEFMHAQIPAAYNLPLFSDEERKIVGTAYKKQGREEAIKIGLVYFGIKMRRMVKEVEAIIAQWPSEKNQKLVDGPLNGTPHRKQVSILIHCWRGGMRSSAIAWLLDLYGFKVYLLVGGYKKFRNYVLDTFKMPIKLKILGGFTGSGKTHILHELEKEGVKTIDLEKLANHRGSAFGALGPQPSQEMFENFLALSLRKTAETSSSLPDNGIWLEDESQRIGTVIIPKELWKQMRYAPLYFIDIPFEERLEHIIDEYGTIDKINLAEAIMRIQKRLGGLEARNAVNALKEDNIRESFRILLAYYDKCYLKALAGNHHAQTRQQKITCATVDKKENAFKLMFG